MVRKKILLLIYILNVIIIIGCAKKSEYPPPGRNTVEWLGDGRYEIFSGQSPLGDNRRYCLYDRKDDNGAVEGNILVYKIYDEYLYVIGLEGNSGQEEEYDEAILTLEKLPERIIYTKVNYESGELQQSEDILAFEEKDKDIFEELLNSKTLHE